MQATNRVLPLSNSSIPGILHPDLIYCVQVFSGLEILVQQKNSELDLVLSLILTLVSLEEGINLLLVDRDLPEGSHVKSLVIRADFYFQ